MKKLFFFVAALLVCNFSMAQEEETAPVNSKTMGGTGTLNFNNTGFGDYYSGGGLGSTTIGGLFNAYLNTTKESGAIWDNLLRVDYGLARVENTNDDNLVKASDVLDFTSKYGIPMKNNDKWYYSAAFGALSQLTDTNTAFNTDQTGLTDLIGLNGGSFGTVQSSFLSPADFTLGLGLDYKPSDNFSAFFGPASTKLRVITNDLIAESLLFGNDPGDNTRFEAGASALANYNDSFLENDMLSFSTGLKLFSNYLEDPQNVDVNWNTVTSLNPWKFITLTYSTDLAYDDNKSFTALANGLPTARGTVNENRPEQGIQWRNAFGIGLTHNFGASAK